MRKFSSGKMLLPFLFIAVLFLSCKDDAYLAAALPSPDVSFVEEFDTVSAAFSRGWKFINVSNPKGTGFWNQGLFNDPNVTGFPATVPFNAYSSKGTYVGYVGADYTSTSAAAGIISTWLISPLTLMKTGDKIVFYTRGLVLSNGTADSTDYGNRLQVRINTRGDNMNIGNGADPGDFDNMLLDINPGYRFFHTAAAQYDPLAYPSTWTKFVATIGTIPSRPAAFKGRFAFRYFVEGGGSNGRATAVAIDSVAFISSK